ncbi:MAG TPA: class I SAM-dependent methyltransferase [Gaiellaceae bacterium]|jgi:SAM-dependent methyltransferase
MPDQDPHRAREIAESFGSDVDRYDRARPRYPEAVVELVLADSPGQDVLDVGIGTGIVAGQFRAAGCRVLGVDVDPRMAEFARRHGFAAEVAKFEDWDSGDRQFDAVVAGQTWHWVDPVAGAAKAARVLRPGGCLAVFWNADRPETELAEAFGEVYARVMPDSLVARRWTSPAIVRGHSLAAVNGYSRLADTTAESIRETGLFSEPRQARFDWERRYAKEDWLDQVPTTGDHQRFPPEQLDELLAGLGAAIDAVGGSFTMPYTTLVVGAARTST